MAQYFVYPEKNFEYLNKKGPVTCHIKTFNWAIFSCYDRDIIDHCCRSEMHKYHALHEKHCMIPL